MSAFVFPGWPPNAINIFFAVVMLLIALSHLMLVCIVHIKCSNNWKTKGDSTTLIYLNSSLVNQRVLQVTNFAKGRCTCKKTNSNKVSGS